MQSRCWNLPRQMKIAGFLRGCVINTPARSASTTRTKNTKFILRDADARQSDRRRLDVAIVGLPNAGKSQMLNILTQSTVSAVSRKRHTTRQQGILGARTVENTQLVFQDTPGFLRHQQAKGEGLNKNEIEVSAATSDTIHHVDFTLVIIDAAMRLTDKVRETLIELMMHAVQSQGRLEFPSDNEDNEEHASSIERNSVFRTDDIQKFAVVLNKVDLVHPKSQLLKMAMEIGTLAEGCIQYQGQTDPENEELVEMNPDDLLKRMPTFFYVSALKEDGTDDLLQFLLDKATVTYEEWPVTAGQATNQSPQERVEQVIAEKIYRCLHKELPYRIQQRNRLFRVLRESERAPGVSSDGKEQEGPLLLAIHQDLLVQTKSHLELVRKHHTLERIRDTAERDLQRIFFGDDDNNHVQSAGRVDLRLHVKLVKKNKA